MIASLVSRDLLWRELHLGSGHGIWQVRPLGQFSSIPYTHSVDGIGQNYEFSEAGRFVTV